MARMSPRHQELDETGRGLCSVPMWMDGCPAGFCDEEAYGERPESPTYRDGWTGELYRRDGRYNGYVPGLACIGHGGPRSRVFKDGDQYCAVFPDFQNLQESPAGFGTTPEEARAALAKETGKVTK